jgi:hypothetical protein
MACDPTPPSSIVKHCPRRVAGAAIEPRNRDRRTDLLRNQTVKLPPLIARLKLVV